MSRLTALEKRANAYAEAMKQYNDLKCDLAQKRLAIKCDQVKFEQERWCEIIVAQRIIDTLPGMVPDIAEMIAEYASEHDHWGNKLCSITDTDRIPHYQLRARCWCEGGWFDRKPVEVTWIGGSVFTLYKTDEKRVVLKDKHDRRYIISPFRAAMMRGKPRGVIKFLAYFRWLKKMTPTAKEWNSISCRFSGLEPDEDFQLDHFSLPDSDE